MNNWIYEHNLDNSARYLLGERGKNNLICVGINPSTATPEKLDNTVTRVKRIADKNGYDGWVMLNIYPQRDTFPNNIHIEKEKEIISANCAAIQNLLADGVYNEIWAAWGTEIHRRPYLISCLKEVKNCFNENFKWLHYGELTKKGHPKHPSRMPYSEEFNEFYIHDYIENQCTT